MNRDFTFKITKRDKKTRARLGVISTPHGDIQTPAFIPVGTQATVKSLTPDEILQTGTRMFFVNSYHMYLRPGDALVHKMGGLHKFMQWDGPLITDSGGFQVFSLGDKKIGKTNHDGETESLVKITEQGVEFQSHIDGSKHFFSPRKSLDVQKNLGADIILPLDDCTSFPVTYKKAQESLERTHRWEEEGYHYYETWKSTKQTLYGIIQGSIYEDLRKQSAKYISSFPFAGFAIGGVSVGESKQEMKDVCSWVTPLLPDAKPRHLLGVGELDDIFDAVEQGIDTFDCVMPTRIARMGHILTSSKLQVKNSKLETKIQKKFEIDINKSEFKEDKMPLDPKCSCFVCRDFSRSYIHHLFKTRELLGYRLATFHNVSFVHTLVSNIRESIANNEYNKLRETWLTTKK